MPKLQKSDLGSQREQAYHSLRSLLILQQVDAGQRLREPEWAAKLGVHRTALREAFARLEADGLVERGEATGYFVPRLTPEDVAEVTKIRLGLECLAVDEVCADAALPLDKVREACDQFAAFLEGGYALGVMEADRRFHESLIDAARMRRLSSHYLRAPLPLIHRRTEDRTNWESACHRTLEEHRAILASLEKRDAKDAKTRLRAHITHRPMLPMRRCRVAGFHPIPVKSTSARMSRIRICVGNAGRFGIPLALGVGTFRKFSEVRFSKRAIHFFRSRCAIVRTVRSAKKISVQADPCGVGSPSIVSRRAAPTPQV